MVHYDKNFDNDSILPSVIHPQCDSASGQVQFYRNLNAIFFKKGRSPCTQEFPEVRIWRKLIDHYNEDTCNITSYYGMFTIKNLPSQSNQTPYQIQTDGIDLEFSNVLQNM